MGFQSCPMISFEDPNTLLSLLTLTAMEVVLGIDNIVFISILVGKLPKEEQSLARNLGIGLALIFRIGLLFAIGYIATLREPIFTIWNNAFSGRDILLLLGGIFLLYKATKEIHHKLEEADEPTVTSQKQSFVSVITMIILIDIVFSVDSILTAVGLVDNVLVMIIAVVISMVIMLVFAKRIASLLDSHPTLKMLALAFLLMIGTLLVAEGFGFHVPKGYVYFAMAFSILVETLNINLRKKGSARK